MRLQLSTLLGICFSISLFSQVDTDSTQSHSGIVKTVELFAVTVSSEYSATDESPFSFQDIDAETIEAENNGREPSFFLSNTPSMTVYSDAGSFHGYSYYRLRGIDQTRINMTLDGIPLNEPEDQGVYFSNYPDLLNSVSRIQVQRGVGTTQNGSASYAGSLQFFSPNLSDSTKKEVGLNYGSFNSYRGYAEYNSGLKKDKGLYIRGSFLGSEGYKYHSTNSSQSVFYSTGIFKEKYLLKLTGFVGRQQNDLAWLGVSQSDINRDPRTNANSKEADEFSQSLTSLQHILFISERSTLKSSLYYSYLNGNYDFDLNNFLGLPSTDEMYNYAFLSHFTGGYTNYTYKISGLKSVTGLHANYYQRRHLGSEFILGELYRNTGFRNEFSLFEKLSYKKGEFTFVGDVQYRYTSFEYDGSVEMDPLKWSFINPKIGVTYQQSKMIDLYGSFGMTSREPTRNDIFNGWDDLPADSLGNPQLNITDPEQVSDLEAGIRIRGKKWSLNTNVYYMDFKNEIVLNGQFGPNGLALHSNVSKSYRTGIELDFKWQVSKKLALVNNSSWNKSVITEADVSFEPILTPPIIVNQAIQYKHKKWIGEINARYQGQSYIDFSNETFLDSYVLLNGSIGYELKKLSINLILNNLLDNQYFNNGYVDFDGTPKYFVQSPINFYSSIVWKI